MEPHDDGEKEVTSDKQPEPENSTPESQPKPKKWWRFGKQLQLKKKRRLVKWRNALMLDLRTDFLLPCKLIAQEHFVCLDE